MPIGYNLAMDSLLAEPIWIAKPYDLESLVMNLSNHSRLAIDTESNSLHAYREQVCLIQFSIPGSDFLVDPLTLEDLSPLGILFNNKAIEKVFHAAEYDLICLRRDFGLTFVDIFDTMQATRILGYKQVGLDSILAEKMGIRLNKHYQKADWGERPLSEEMLNYARLDTHYLLELRDILQVELQQRGRWELAVEEFTRLATCNGTNKSEIEAWQRVKGTQHFTEHQLTILHELCLWRETQAKKMGRPVFKVIDDKRLMSIALANPRIQTDLKKLNLTPRQILIYGDDIIRAVYRGQKGELIHRPMIERPSQKILDRLKRLSEWRKAVAVKFSLESDLILPKTWMNSIARQNPGTLEELSLLMPESPWRLKSFGMEILKTIHPSKPAPK